MRRSTVNVLAFGVLLVGVLLQPAQTLAQPQITLTPASGPVGTTVNATGTVATQPGSQMRVNWDTPSMTLAQTTIGDGRFQVSFQVPRFAPVGEHRIVFQLVFPDGRPSVTSVFLRSFTVMAEGPFKLLVLAPGIDARQSGDYEPYAKASDTFSALLDNLQCLSLEFARPTPLVPCGDGVAWIPYS